MSIFPRTLYDKFVCCFSIYTRLPKAEHYISGLKFAHLFVAKNFVDLLIDYLKEFSDIQLPAASKIVNVQEGFSSILVIFTANLSDAYLGLFKTIVLANILFLIGLVLFCIAAYVDSIDEKILFVALFFIALGISGRDFLLEWFLSDQRSGDTIVEDDEVHQVSWSWRPYVMLLLCAAVSFIFSYFISGKLYVIITIVAMFVGLLCFLSSHSFYTKKPAKGGPLGTTFHVFKAAILCKPGQSHKNDSVLLPSIPFFGWLDRAANLKSSSNSKEELETNSSTVAQVELTSIIKEERETNSTVVQVESSSISKEENRKVTQVKEVKRLLSMIPMWTTFVVYSLVEAAGSTFFLEQSSSINDDFPLVIFVICRDLVSLIASDMGKILPKFPFLKTRRRLATLVQIGIGMSCSFSCAIVAWRVEKFRSNTYVRSNTYENINVLWLTPQFLLIGCMKGFAEEGLNEFFKKQVSGSMRDYGPPFTDFILGIGKFISAIIIVIFKDWFDEDVESSHLDRYYEFLAWLSLLNFFLFVSIAVWYGNQQAEDENLIPVKVILPQQQAEKENSFPIPIILPQVQPIHSFPPRGSHVPSQEKEGSPIRKLRRAFTTIGNEKKA